MARNRQNVFTRHPDGNEILELLINKKISQVKAAERLGCTSANISIYLKDHNLRPTLAQRQPKPAPSASELLMDKIEALGEFSLSIDSKTPDELTAAVGWRAMLQGLLKMSVDDLEPDQYVKVANVILRMMQYQFKNPVPRIPDELVKLDPETENRIIQRLGAFCEQCAFRRNFDERKTREQNKQRLEPQQSPPMG